MLYKEALPAVLKTLSLDTNGLGPESVRCTIKEYLYSHQDLISYRWKVVNPGFLRSKYVVYVIDTEPKGFHVERRYNEFLSLRGELLRLNPGNVIAPIPKKKVGKNGLVKFG